MSKNESNRKHQLIDTDIRSMLSLHTTIGNERTRLFAKRVEMLHQRPNLELTTKIALLLFLQLLYNHAIGFPQVMTLIDNPEETSLKNHLFNPISDQSTVSDLSVLYDELENITGN